MSKSAGILVVAIGTFYLAGSPAAKTVAAEVQYLAILVFHYGEQHGSHVVDLLVAHGLATALRSLGRRIVALVARAATA